ncbi:MAG: hypothetical protein ACI4JZ_06555 [Oscillospiraceae bacterium]
MTIHAKRTKVFGQAFFKRLVGCGAKPHLCALGVVESDNCTQIIREIIAVIAAKKGFELAGEINLDNSPS